MYLRLTLRTPSFLDAEAADDVKRSDGGGSLLPLIEMGTVPPSVQGNDMLRPVIRFSHRHVCTDNCSCLIEQHSRTIAVIWLSCACKHTDCSGVSFQLSPTALLPHKKGFEGPPFYHLLSAGRVCLLDSRMESPFVNPDMWSKMGYCQRKWCR